MAALGLKRSSETAARLFSFQRDRFNHGGRSDMRRVKKQLFLTVIEIRYNQHNRQQYDHRCVKVFDQNSVVHLHRHLKVNIESKITNNKELINLGPKREKPCDYVNCFSSPNSQGLSNLCVNYTNWASLKKKNLNKLQNIPNSRTHDQHHPPTPTSHPLQAPIESIAISST